MTRCPPGVKCRGVIPALNHIMLQSDQLAQEFNEILNAVEIFAPFQPLDESIVFYAPLTRNTRDLRLNTDAFQRNSDGWWRDANGIYRLATANQARFENNGLLMEPAGTNKCVHYNAAPDPALSGFSITGDPAAVFRRVDDSAELAAAGLSEIVPGGFVFELDNSAGSSTANADDNGVFGNLNTHTISAFCRKIQGANVTSLRNSGSNFITDFDSANFERIVAIGEPTGVNQRTRIACQAGTVARFILMQNEENTKETSPIVTEGTAGQRAVDGLSYANPSSFFNQTQGMALIEGRAIANSDVYVSASNTESVFSLIEDRFNLLFLRAPSAQPPSFRSQMSSGQTAQGQTASWVAGDRVRIAVRWNRVSPAFQVGHRINENNWLWGNEITVNLADFTIGNDLYVHYLPNRFGSNLSNATIYDEDRGREFIEANY